jgi:hypothetical protein
LENTGPELDRGGTCASRPGAWAYNVESWRIRRC